MHYTLDSNDEKSKGVKSARLDNTSDGGALKKGRLNYPEPQMARGVKRDIVDLGVKAENVFKRPARLGPVLTERCSGVGSTCI